jgi:hypothetical protein
MNEIKEVKLGNGKQLFGELKDFTHRWGDAITIEIEGTITPVEIRSSNDFQNKVRLFRLTTSHSLSMARDISLPTYEVLEKRLWCPALRYEIIEYLKSIPTHYDYADDKSIKLAIPYILKKLRNEDRPPRTLALGEEAKLIGELEIDKRHLSSDLVIVGRVTFADGEEKLVKFYKFKNIFRIWSFAFDCTTRFERKNKELWNKKLADLVVSFITELMGFINFRFIEDLKKGRERIIRGGDRARFCNRLREQLLTADEEKLHHPEVIAAFRTIEDICGLEFKTENL